MLPVKEEIRKLNQLKQQNADKETLMELNSKLIEACRHYVKDTDRPPAAGDSSHRVNLVADTLSYTMRENNQLDKELSLECGGKKTFALDDNPCTQGSSGEKAGIPGKKGNCGNEAPWSGERDPETDQGNGEMLRGFAEEAG